MSLIGQGIAKVDGLALVKGAPAYTSDLDINDNGLVLKILRSPHASARILSIDAAAARAMEGVACVLTYRDVPDIRFTLAGQSPPEPSPYDRRVLDEYVRYVGDEVAIVAAVDEETAQRAVTAITVQYEVLPPVLELDSAIDHVNRVHLQQPHTNFDVGCDAARNIAARCTIEHGDVEAELARCEVVVEQSYRTQAQAHCMMETFRASTALDVNGRLQVMSSTQIPFHVRRHLSRILGIPKSQIKVLKPRVGGGFGGKQTASVEIFPALVTLLTGKPAKIVYTRKETFCATTTRHAMQLQVRIGADRQGTIRAVDIHCLADTGAYGEHASTVFTVTGHKTLPLYNTARASRYQGYAVYTNKVPGGALRGYGAPQGTFALESAINELAEKLAMDPAALRLKNLIQPGQASFALDGSRPKAPVVLQSSRLHQCIETGKEMIGWQDNYPRVRIDDQRVCGYGMAVAMQGSGIARVDSGSVILKLNEDGFFSLLHSAADMGQGADTVLSQMVAEQLEVDMAKIVNCSFDLDTLPYDSGAYASSGTYVTGNAAVWAALAMKKQMVEAAAKLLQVEATQLTYGCGMFAAADGRRLSLAELGQQLSSFAGRDQLVAKGTFGGISSPPPFIAGFAAVEVDLETGRCWPKEYVAVVDCGRVINRNLARIQVEGGVAMGIGFALFEDVRFTARGRLATDSFMEYKIPCRQDIGVIRVAFEESNEPTGPFGAKSIGEVVCNSPAPAIAHAICNATGAHFRQLPIRAEDLLLRLQNTHGGK